MLGFGGQGSSQEQQSKSGLRGPYADRLSADLYGATKNTLGMAKQYANSPFGYFQGQHVSSLVPTNQFGLPVATTGALEAFGDQMFSKASAGGALRGNIQPESTSGVVGSALQGIGQFLIPYITEFQKYMTQLPESLMASRLGFLQNTIGSAAPLLGSESQYKGSSFGFNVQGGVGGAQ